MPLPSADAPRLSPAFCFNTTVLRDFLRTSRSSLDDSIVQNLNSVARPGSRPFDPRSTASRVTAPRRGQLDASDCLDFREKILFPGWDARSSVITYCSQVAQSPDLANEPQAAAALLAGTAPLVADERTDPYSARQIPIETRQDLLKQLLANEEVVEKIIRDRSWRLIAERCGGLDGQSRSAVFAEWKSRQEGQRHDRTEDSRP